MEQKNMMRAKRRAFHARLKRKARIKAERTFAEDQTNRIRPGGRTVMELYKGFMLGDGHWINGGCPVAGCGLCQPYEPTAAMIRDAERARQEIAENWGDNGRILDSAR